MKQRIKKAIQIMLIGIMGLTCKKNESVIPVQSVQEININKNINGLDGVFYGIDIDNDNKNDINFHYNETHSLYSNSELSTSIDLENGFELITDVGIKTI